MWEDLTVFYGNELIVGDLSDLWEGFNIISKISNFGKQNLTLGSVVPLAMFTIANLHIYSFTYTIAQLLTKPQEVH